MRDRIRAIADRITEQCYQAAREESRSAEDPPVRSYWRGKRIQATADASALYDLIGDAEPDWEAMICLARSGDGGPNA